MVRISYGRAIGNADADVCGVRELGVVSALWELVRVQLACGYVSDCVPLTRITVRSELCPSMPLETVFEGDAESMTPLFRALHFMTYFLAGGWHSCFKQETLESCDATEVAIRDEMRWCVAHHFEPDVLLAASFYYVRAGAYHFERGGVNWMAIMVASRYFRHLDLVSRKRDVVAALVGLGVANVELQRLLALDDSQFLRECADRRYLESNQAKFRRAGDALKLEM